VEGGAEGVEPLSPSSGEQREESIADWMETLCPFYMTRGVSCEEFWHGDYTKLKYYVDAYELNRQKRSEELWLAGLYTYDAVAVAIGNAMRGKNKRPLRYVEEPLRVIPYTEEEKAYMAEQERQKEIEQFRQMMEKWERQQELNERFQK